MHLLNMFFIFLYFILGIFNGISGCLISILCLMYIFNTLFINLNLSIIYIFVGILCFLLYFKLPKKYILKLHSLNRNRKLKEKYTIYQKRFLLLIGLYSLFIDSVWIFTNSTFLKMDRDFSLFRLNLILFNMLILFLQKPLKMHYYSLILYLYNYIHNLLLL